MTPSDRPDRGFTLIEIMVVLAIIAAAMTIALPRLFKKENNIKSVARHFLVLGKEVRNHARLKNATMRLAIDMDPQKPMYWVEKANGPVAVRTGDDLAKKKDDEGKEIDPDGWQMYASLTKKKKELPSGLFFGSVETINMKAPQTEGIAYIHFFPEGLMEATALQITDRQRLTWTLVYNPLTGQADIAESAKSLKEVQK